MPILFMFNFLFFFVSSHAIRGNWHNTLLHMSWGEIKFISVSWDIFQSYNPSMHHVMYYPHYPYTDCVRTWHKSFMRWHGTSNKLHAFLLLLLLLLQSQFCSRDMLWVTNTFFIREPRKTFLYFLPTNTHHNNLLQRSCKYQWF